MCLFSLNTQLLFIRNFFDRFFSWSIINVTVSCVLTEKDKRAFDIIMIVSITSFNVFDLTS